MEENHPEEICDVSRFGRRVSAEMDLAMVVETRYTTWVSLTSCEYCNFSFEDTPDESRESDRDTSCAS